MTQAPSVIFKIPTSGTGITVYLARAGGGRWRAVWHEDGQRQQCEAAS